VNVYNARLSALSQLDRARNDILQARRELEDFQRGMQLLGMDVGDGVDCALNAISLAAARMHAARCLLEDNVVCDKKRGA